MTPETFPHPLLQPAETLALPASDQVFPVKEGFEKAPRVRFSTIWNEFKKRFYGKVEQPHAAFTLQKYRLLAIAPDAPIIAELGGANRVECPLAATLYLMSRQGRGEDGILQTAGYANIFYSKDLKGSLCAVRVGWDGEGWVIDAISVDDPLAWNGKHEIFCPLRA